MEPSLHPYACAVQRNLPTRWIHHHHGSALSGHAASVHACWAVWADRSRAMSYHYSRCLRSPGAAHVSMWDSNTCVLHPQVPQVSQSMTHVLHGACTSLAMALEASIVPCAPRKQPIRCTRMQPCAVHVGCPTPRSAMASPQSCTLLVKHAPPNCGAGQSHGAGGAHHQGARPSAGLPHLMAAHTGKARHAACQLYVAMHAMHALECNKRYAYARTSSCPPHQASPGSPTPRSNPRP